MIKGCVQRNPVYDRKDFCLRESILEPPELSTGAREVTVIISDKFERKECALNLGPNSFLLGEWVYFHRKQLV